MTTCEELRELVGKEMVRDLVSLTDLTARDIAKIIDRAVEMGRDPRPAKTLTEQAVGIYFAGPSTRTRTSFWRAATALGAEVINYDSGDLQMVTGETWEDTARVLAGYLDILIVRTNGYIGQLRRLAGQESLGIVNALTEYEHPTQALADLATLKEEFGELAGKHILYVGEGNGTAVALAHAVALTAGLTLTIVTPHGYGMQDDALASSWHLAGSRERIREVRSFDDVPVPADAVYTSRWQQMGMPKGSSDWLASFEPYQVNKDLLDRVSNERTVVLHDLPAVREQEITSEVLDGQRSRAFRQAEHKLTAAIAVLEWCTQATK